ncbi:nucleotidyltransferase domain-containing protein [Streptomyces sp. SP17KL33]|uniref:nucleotidyltransferase domain-containing protein n=1 Tax=Streptomyces sp. SP17KL33 TaxID=3002534 RepID=UPI002E76EBCC|nr:nucleotidyltransferase domain-containing protein [Streptomyces sp. SP17KL33]MEE1835888.1 nucleotidyltransferase domain-containing protein [Streptomyces sp. SP17KL33]
MQPPHPHSLVRDHTVYACVMGSRAFGLATDDSDTDLRGVFLAPTEMFWRFEKPPTHVEGPAEEQFSWELERFCNLALRANPNILECLHSPLVEHVDATGRELLALRGAFLSRQAHETFARYALGQRKKLDADVRTHGAPRWKHAMHLLRLLMSCRDLLRTGALTVDVGDQREPLLAVKHGEVAWARVESWMARLATEAEEAMHRSPLPPEPDRARVEDFLVRTRHASALRARPALGTGPDPETAQDPGTGSDPHTAETDPDHEIVQGVVRGGVLRER